MHLREDAAARSNIGILNAGRRETRVRVQLFDGAGAEVARFTRRVEARQIEQVNRPFETVAGRTDIEIGYAVVTVLEGEEVVVYASVVDNQTNDPTTIPMKRGFGSEASHVAAAARGDGAAGSVWRTDLGLLNLSEGVAGVSVVFHQDDGDDLALALDLAAGEHRLLDDVVGRLGGESSGSIEVRADTPVLVSSRTYNQSSAGTFGQYIDGAAVGDTVSEGRRVWLPQLQQNGEVRTNIGLLNVGRDQLKVKVHLHEADGTLLATSQRSLAAGARLQLQEPFDRIAGRNDIAGGYAVVEVAAGDGLLGYASVIDNRTNDPTTFAMVR
jgi:hypothetical protein